MTTPHDVRMIYPRRATVARINPGEERARVAVAPYETIILETVPVDESRAVRAISTGPQAALLGGASSVLARAVSSPSRLWSSTSLPFGIAAP